MGSSGERGLRKGFAQLLPQGRLTSLAADIKAKKIAELLNGKNWTS
jgi:hypothetical protein